MTAPAIFDRPTRPRPVSIIIPAYGAADRLRTCLESLVSHAPADCTILVLDDATPDNSVRTLCAEMQDRLAQLTYLRSDMNRGFVQTCNWGYELLRSSESDLLLLNSDTEVTSGFLEEMHAVLCLHEKHAVVTPRSNSATIFSIPSVGDRLAASESYAVWQRIHRFLPRYQGMPTAVGFCMLIRREVLEHFGLFDEIYGPGYNEENDFVCRINRFGYSVVAANWAYVFHHEAASFGSQRASLEAINHDVLLERCPEYSRKLSDYLQFQIDPVELFANLYAPHRPRILFDLFHILPTHSGTSDFALNLLHEIRRLIEDDCDLYVGIVKARDFFANELAGYRIYEDAPNARMTFDLVYKPCQLFTWDELETMNRLAPRLAYTLQDIIGVRCDYLSAAYRRILFLKTAELCDCVFTISEFSRSDFNAFYGTDVPMRVIYHGTNAGMTAGEFRSGEYVLIMGNQFAHKGVTEALRHLDGNWPIKVLAGPEPESGESSNVRWLTSGRLTRQTIRDLLSNARLLVYPSHYEGYGLPVVDALALGKPVVVLDSSVNREIAEKTGDSNLHRIASLTQLQATVQELFDSTPQPPSTHHRRWSDAAQEYVASFREMLARDIDIPRLRARWDLLRTLESAP